LSREDYPKHSRISHIDRQSCRGSWQYVRFPPICDTSGLGLPSTQSGRWRSPRGDSLTHSTYLATLRCMEVLSALVLAEPRQ
jgi:hypothetical protein